MLSCKQTASSKLEKLLHLVGWFVWIIWFRVLTPLLLRLESSGMQQCVIKQAVPDIFRNHQTQKMHILQDFKTRRTAHPTICSHFLIGLNIHHTKTQAKHYIILVTPSTTDTGLHIKSNTVTRISMKE
jgi:hypothetical protein